MKKEDTLNNFSSYILAQGHLTKKGQEFSTWSKRFFIMLEDMILYYKDENDLHHPSGIIYLYKSNIKKNVSETKREFCFQITTNQRKEIVLQAADENMKETWCSLLQETVLKITKDYDTEIDELTDEYEKTKLENLGLEKQIELVSKSAQSLKDETIQIKENIEKATKTTIDIEETTRESISSRSEDGEKVLDLIQTMENNFTMMNRMISNCFETQKNFLDACESKKVTKSTFQTLYEGFQVLNEERSDIVDQMIEIQDAVGESVREAEKEIQKYVAESTQNSTLYQICGITNTEMSQKDVSKIAKKKLTELKKKRIQLEKDVGLKKTLIDENEETLKELKLHKKVLLKELKNVMGANTESVSTPTTAVDTPVEEEE
eukprot:gene4173-7483_t